jgi:hypothetical protein
MIFTENDFERRRVNVLVIKMFVFCRRLFEKVKRIFNFHRTKVKTSTNLLQKKKKMY